MINNLMKKLSFIVSIIGIAFLIGFLFYPGQEVEDISDLEINSKVFIGGNVVSEREFGDFKILKFDRKYFDIVCEDCSRHISYNGIYVEIEGIVEEYEGEKQIRVLKISIPD